MRKKTLFLVLILFLLLAAFLIGIRFLLPFSQANQTVSTDMEETQTTTEIKDEPAATTTPTPTRVPDPGPAFEPHDESEVPELTIGNEDTVIVLDETQGVGGF